MNPSNSQTTLPRRWRAIEFFAGIGGFATAWPTVHVVAAFDIHQKAAEVYRANHPHPYIIREIESISLDDLRCLNANIWWMSPPCQPYTTRGKQRDIDDPRARSLARLINLIPQCLPDYIALENVLGFVGSRAQSALLKQLSKCSYHAQDIQLCPTELNWPNRRPRYYLIASRVDCLTPWRPKPFMPMNLSNLLDASIGKQTSDLWLAEEDFAKIADGADRVSPNSSKPTACFASSYGRALVRSGSYLEHPDGSYRRFSPREVASLMGYPPTFKLPSSLTDRELWKLFGNSLSIPAVRYVLSHLEVE